MSRSDKRRRHRERQKLAKKGRLMPENITLANPVSDHFEAFIVGNATKCEAVVKQGSGRGKTVAICGAGPSLADDAHEYCPTADEVWGCNSAMTYLLDNGHRCTHGFTIDQTAHMIDEWASAPDIEYLIASSCHPFLVDYIQGEKGRRVTMFHNFVGIRKPDVVLCGCGHELGTHDPDNGNACIHCECQKYVPERMAYEDWMYSVLYDPTVRVGAGLNSVTRAIDLACFMGFDKIYVLGADCALRVNAPCPQGFPHGSPEHMNWLRNDTIMHADGGNALASAATPLTLGGEIDGRHWETKPDMIVSATWMVRMARQIPQLELIGDTLPNALMDKDDDFLDRLPNLIDKNGDLMRYEITTQSGYDGVALYKAELL